MHVLLLHTRIVHEHVLEAQLFDLEIYVREYIYIGVCVCVCFHLETLSVGAGL